MCVQGAVGPRSRGSRALPTCPPPTCPACGPPQSSWSASRPSLTSTRTQGLGMLGCGDLCAPPLYSQYSGPLTLLVSRAALSLVPGWQNQSKAANVAIQNLALRQHLSVDAGFSAQAAQIPDELAACRCPQGTCCHEPPLTRSGPQAPPAPLLQSAPSHQHHQQGTWAGMRPPPQGFRACPPSG